MSAKKEAEAWKTLVNVLPIILSAEDCEGHIKSNFEGIDQACKDLGQTPDAVFGRLKRMSSEIVRQAKSAKVRNNGNGNSSDSDNDQPLEFTKKAIIPKTTQPMKYPAKYRKCTNCGGPISSKSKGLCRDCHNNRGSLTSSKKGKTDICVQCLEDRVIVEDGLCEDCYAEEDGNQDREAIEQDLSDGEEASANNVSSRKQTPAKNFKKSIAPASTTKQTPAKNVKKSIAPASTTKRDRKTSKCIDCEAPVHPKSKRCMDCHKAFLKVKPADAKAKKDKVENTSVKPADAKAKKDKVGNTSVKPVDIEAKKKKVENDFDKSASSKLSVKKENAEDGPIKQASSKLSVKKENAEDGPIKPTSPKLSIKKEPVEDFPQKLSSSGSLKVTLKRSTIKAGIESKDFSKKSRIANY